MKKQISQGAVRLFRLSIASTGILIVTAAVGADLFSPGKSVMGSSQILALAVGLLLILSSGVLYLSTKPIRLVLLIDTLLLCLLGVEFICHIAFRIQEKKEQSFAYDLSGSLKRIPDPLLDYRLPPNAPGHDSRGFRNEIVPSHADIVAIGDSQTWGPNATREEAWPQVAGKLLHKSVYNMSLGGYGPVQYTQLTKQAMALSPRIVLIAIYFGNDLWDAYDVAYRNNTYANLRQRSDLADDTIIAKTKMLGEPVIQSQPFRQKGLMAFLSGTATFMLIKQLPMLRNADELNTWKSWARSYPEKFSVYDVGGNTATAFTCAYRMLALDRKEPRIMEGLRITEQMLLQMQREAFANDCKYMVLFIPTKESVYGQVVENHHLNMGQLYASLLEMETANRHDLTAHCEANNIPCYDVLPALREALKRGEKIYPSGGDGHPLAQGYAIIASAVAEELKRRGWS